MGRANPACDRSSDHRVCNHGRRRSRVAGYSVRSAGLSTSVLRDAESEARQVAQEIGRHNGGWEGPGQAWTPARLAEKLAPYVELGFREIYLDMPAPYDDETLAGFVGEVRPMLA